MTNETTGKRPATGLGKRLRWLMFRGLEGLSNWRNPRPPLTLPDNAPSAGPALWVFVSTIGELNGISTLLRALSERHSSLQLVLISDHAHYREPYLEKYPQAVYVHTSGTSTDAARLAQQYPPTLLILGEIPCLPADAPCRLSYGFVHQARRDGARIAMANGWLYGYAPGCRMDSIERERLSADYLSDIDLLAVQTTEVADTLVTAGAAQERLVVTGSMKFDALQSASWSPDQGRSPRLLQAMASGTRNNIVVGCIRNDDEQTMVIDAFARLLAERPDTFMVFAHRHPEIAGNIPRLCAELEHFGIRHARKSDTGDLAPPDELQCLVLDTMGELKDVYAAATVTHVGVDHNLLEPLTFGKPITTRPQWDTNFPNYPIFVQLRDSGIVSTRDSAAELCATWSEWLDDPQALQHQQQQNRGALKAAGGATAKTLAAVELLLSGGMTAGEKSVNPPGKAPDRAASREG